MGKEKSTKPKEDTSKKSAKKKATASSSKKVASKAQKSSTGKRPAGSKIASKMSSQKSSKAASKASSKVSSRASSSKAKPVASSRVTKAATKRSGGSMVKSKTSKKKPPTVTKANKSCKSKKSKEESMPVTDSNEEKKKSSSGKKSSKSKPTKPEVEDGEEAAATAEEAQDMPNNEQAEYNGNDVEYEEAEEEGQVEEEKPKEEKLEFTKPTINQMKKEKKEKPLSMAETITGREFEQLYDEISELNSGVQMLKHSYGSIIKSLVAMQDTRRAKKKAAKEAAQRPADGKVTFLTTLSTCDPNELRTKSCLEAADKYDIERFLNPLTREETFQQLFDEVDDLNKSFEKIRTFYDARGRFQRDKYEEQEEIKLDRIQFNEYKLWIKKLASTVDDIARNYNDDLLNMFRLN